MKDLASKETSNESNPFDGDDEGVEVQLRSGDSERYPSGKYRIIIEHNLYIEKSKYTYLVVNAKTAEKYTKAMNLSMELMANLYEEYKLFCDEKNIPVPYETRIKKYEYIQNDCPLIILNDNKEAKSKGSLDEEGNQKDKTSKMEVC